MDDRTARLSEIKRKRDEIKKARRKLILKRLFVTFCVLCVLVLCALSLTVFFPVQSIVIRNPDPYTAEQIVEKSGIEKGKNIFISAMGAKEKIVTELPYIKEVKITRKLPGSIIIEAEKGKPFMCFKCDEGYLLCDTDYKVLEKVTSPPEEVVSVTGCEIKKGDLGHIIQFKDADAQKNAQSVLNVLKEKSYLVSKLDISNLANITFEIKGRFIVKLGSAANLENKLLHLDEMIKNINEDLTGRIDLSYWTAEDPRGIFKQETIK